ncbi:MAG TPA: methylated-DNA--[protein]-cysteine S-methyltransferase [Candidatus Enterococcus avicola]|uniref:Methylated-DNA--protein-cysteine methyltransferase n=1 Tax=Candidatus Enterococcus avicola TaxID=2838561 RepID=A0A9D2JGS8_9ENTE|nr:methylated-DNA--[protein]-cysteine S-methyltransferase [Candidatus Enterococcus avicola]
MKGEIKKVGTKIEIYTQTYDSPIGDIYLTSDGQALTGIYYNRSEFEKKNPLLHQNKSDITLFLTVKRWLDAYFRGEQPEIDFPLAPQGTDFQAKVWEEIRKIPYGQTTTYGEIAQKIAKKMGKTTMSAQAVGGAVGSNPISIIIPCHRVIGKTGSVTGYGGGIERKLKLFALEKVQESAYFVPENVKEARSFVNFE